MEMVIVYIVLLHCTYSSSYYRFPSATVMPSCAILTLCKVQLASDKVAPSIGGGFSDVPARALPREQRLIFYDCQSCSILCTKKGGRHFICASLFKCTFPFLLYNEHCTEKKTHAASCKILKVRKLFVFFLFRKGMSYLLFKCINEDLTLHRKECFSYYNIMCMYVSTVSLNCSFIACRGKIETKPVFVGKSLIKF